MSYLAISVKEALQRINNSVNGWFLPAVQRPYVWGSRHENEVYICKLFDSILKRYPIGGLIIWNCEENVAYREFIKDYIPGETAKLAEIGLYGKKDKCLIYDGQQRLQTLYSCLCYTFNGKVLIYNLLYNTEESYDSDEIGFSFVEKNTEIKWYQIRMNELFSKQPNEKKSDFRKAILSKNPTSGSAEEELIEKNIDDLWQIFVEIETKSLAYFPIQTTDENVVNEIFKRLNTGGMPLTQADMLFSTIKGYNELYNFEEELQNVAKEIFQKTGCGYQFNAYNILLVLYLLVKGSVRIDHHVNENDILEFKTTWEKLKKPLVSFFDDYLWDQFKINNSSIIPRIYPLLPMIVYFYEIFNKGFSFKAITQINLKKINQYFIKSQINDWGLQTYVSHFSRIIRENTKKSEIISDFPLDKIENFIQEKNQRNISISENTFVSYGWFALKILTPNRIYLFDPDIRGRFNPEIDHIFPIRMKDATKEYHQFVDIIWNMQPTKGVINGYKTNIHPKIFFTDKYFNTKGEQIIGSKYICDYDFLPKDKNNQYDFNDPIWDNYKIFIENRRKEMKAYIENTYDIIIK